MDFLNYIKEKFNNSVENAKKEIEKALMEENINKVLNPLKKAIKTAEKDFDNIKSGIEKLIKIDYLPGKIDISEKKNPKKRQLPENNEKQILWKIIKSKKNEEKKRLILKLRSEFIKDKRFLVIFYMNDGKTWYHKFTDKFLSKLLKFLDGEEVKSTKFQSYKELETIYLDREVVKIEYEYIEKGRRDKGQYSKVFHNVEELNTSIIQIYRGVEDFPVIYPVKGTISDDDYLNLSGIIKEKPKNMKARANTRPEHCLIHSLKVLGATTDDIQKVKEFVGENSFRTRDLKKLGEILDCNFTVTVLSHNEKEGQTKPYGDKTKNNHYHLVLYDGHFMPNIDFEITEYAIKNYNRVIKYKANGEDKEIKFQEYANWNKIYNFQTFKNERKPIAQRHTKKHSIKTSALVGALNKSGRFYWNDTIYEQTEERRALDLSKITEQNLHDCQTPVEIIKPKKTNTKLCFFADFESLVKNEENKHKAFILGCVSMDDSYRKVFRATKENINKNDIFSQLLDNIVLIYKHLYDKERQTNKNSKFVIYFHNLKYDFSLILANPYINLGSPCEKGGQLYSVPFFYKKYQFELRDSYKMISMPLRDFKAALGLTKGKKDFAIYEYFTEDNMDDDLAKLKDLQKFDSKLTEKKLNKRKMSHFLTEDKKSIQVTDFYIDYMMADCETMRDGLIKADEIALEQWNLSVFDFLTISSMANCYVSNECYQGLFYMSGLLRETATKANVGGKTCIKDNEKQSRGRLIEKKEQKFIKPAKKSMEDFKNEIIKVSKLTKDQAKHVALNLRKKLMDEFKNRVLEAEDFDGVSMYPSAMAISSLPLGRAKILTREQAESLSLKLLENVKIVEALKKITENRDDLLEKYKKIKEEMNEYDHYIVEVRLKVEGYQQIPMLCRDNEDGTRDWSNTPSELMIMNKIDLVNLPKYYNVKELEITQGFYWNEGKNENIQTVIQKIFQARLKAKSEGNDGLQNMLKLFMNSAYGKCNVKASKSNIKYIRRKDRKNFIQNNFDFIKSMEGLDETGEDNDRFKVKLSKHTYIHSNLAHIAGIYLSNSKIIVNDVFNVMTAIGAEALYTDTDSIHVHKKDIPAIAQKYRDIYGKELIGKQMGQFHDDFQKYKPKEYSKYQLEELKQTFIKYGKKIEANRVEEIQEKIKGFGNSLVIAKIVENELLIKKKFCSEGVKIKVPKDLRIEYPQRSNRFIAVGKKVYMDALINDFDDNIDYHVRFKGANEANILSYCKNQKITVVQFYEKLYRGDKVRLDLCAGRTRFDFDKKGRVFTKTKFDRCFQFLSKEQKSISQQSQ